MLHTILIAGTVGVILGILAFLFGHATAAKYWKEVADTLTTAKIRAEDELIRVQSKLRSMEETFRSKL